ncbi:MAG: hypothetical protein HFJ83_01720 [Muribaculaceae bacterium]|jgi:hypothetical protein|nr:hypothetical protein [Muribaculaceae bacterium]
MKKLLLSIAVVAALCAATASCGKSADSTASMKSKIENCTNTDSLRAYVEQAKAYADKLVAEGKVDEARKYLAELEPVVKSKAPALSGALSTVESTLDKVKENASDKADEAKNSTAAAVDSAKSAVGSAAEAVKDKAADVASAVKEKTQDVKEGAADAAQKGADKVKEILK